ncbi:excinuclease ABC subunit UvrB, partial [Rhizobium leguminosarum]|nr:excinuclease ABC subunit UvrB [Rhizobium leguminosarum]
PYYFTRPTLDEMGRDTADPAKKTLFRKNDLDEMTVGRTEKPVIGQVPEKPDAAKSTKRFSPLLEGQPERDNVRPVVRGKTGVGSYEDPGEQKRKGRTKGKTGRPGR